MSEATWGKYEKERNQYEEPFRNPFLVWARVGGEYGYWGGEEVATQLREVQEFLQWEQKQALYTDAVLALKYPGPQTIKYWR